MTAFNKDNMVDVLVRLLHWKSARIWFINNIVLNETLSRGYLTHLATVSDDVVSANSSFSSIFPEVHLREMLGASYSSLRERSRHRF